MLFGFQQLLLIKCGDDECNEYNCTPNISYIALRNQRKRMWKGRFKNLRKLKQALKTRILFKTLWRCRQNELHLYCHFSFSQFPTFLVRLNLQNSSQALCTLQHVVFQIQNPKEDNKSLVNISAAGEVRLFAEFLVYF